MPGTTTKEGSPEVVLSVSLWHKEDQDNSESYKNLSNEDIIESQACTKDMTEVLKAGVLSDEIDLGALAHNAAEQAEEFVRKVWEASWKVCHYKNLPKWLQDNDFLHRGHRPPLPSFRACFKSIFRLHTETGNIWTHLLGCIAFIGVGLYFVSRPSIEIQAQEKIVFGAFFMGAIICLGFSFAFHTLSCHSVEIGRLFSKLDYCGIALLIMGSFVPWLYYGFYCHFQPKVIYLSVVCVLGVLSIVVSLWDKFSEPGLRPLRAGVFMSFGLSGVIPAVHYSIMEGWFSQISRASLGWLILMGLLYITGALLYALRVPERWFPGKFDIWFQSHQLFHVLVIAAAFVHYHGITEMAMYRVMYSECTVPTEPITF
ncbi:adiponectin receptor protein isoform X3 [Drosophila tropicalis]|uniref:adiponectin receptor protein isoform X3 n=1 Tax=Drosophila tropicalis TaxID=46794 RepID=UPI0035AC0D81